jgi:5-methyltetrahydrofolate--homocysteine methyltransferase
MGTELMKRGLEPGACPELWGLTHRRALLDIHKSYVDAGADVVLTNSFGANRWKLEGYGLRDRLAELNAFAVSVANEAARAGTFVVGDVGPTGRFVAPLGTDPAEAFVEVFAEQAAALAGAGVDAIALETFTALDELLAAIEGARRTGLPVIASMSFSPTQDGRYRTMMGNEAGDSARALDAAGADVISANCGVGADEYERIARALCSATKRPVMIEPNAGMPELVNGQTVFPMSAEEMATYVRPILAAGARIIGGCCGTTPEHIRAVRRVVSQLS